MSVVALLQLQWLVRALAELGQDDLAFDVFVFSSMQALSLQGGARLGRHDGIAYSITGRFLSGSKPCICIWLQALAYQWLGRWYDEIDQDYKQAQDCYERAVALDDDDIIASKTALPLCLTRQDFVCHSSSP